MIRTLVSRLHESLKVYLLPSRRKICIPVTISVERESNGVRRQDTGRLVRQETMPTIKGETKDLSENGIAFIVASVRLGQDYLVGAGRPLNVVLDLPTGKICFRAVGLRHKPVGQNASASKYLIGARILQISEADRRIYAQYLRHGYKAQDLENKRLATLGVTNN